MQNILLKIPFLVLFKKYNSLFFLIQTHQSNTLKIVLHLPIQNKADVYLTHIITFKFKWIPCFDKRKKYDQYIYFYIGFNF